jgi:membrane-associated phospholipid phosphatase
MAAVTGVTPEQRETAQYWADDPGSTATPAGHWFSIANHVLQRSEADLMLAAETYVRLGMALNDAFISCWATKFRELYIRPITYIQRVIDPGWNLPRLTDPLLTPPFPEYTSGHSVVSAAAATVLSALFGEETPFVDDFHVGRGFNPRPYRSFWEAAEEAAASRLVGGIHFRSGIEHGVDEGRCVAERTLAIDLVRSGE